MQPVTELKLKPVGQAWIDGPELGEGAAALLRVEIAQVGEGQFEATAIQIQVHSSSSAAGSQRHSLGPARGDGQISS